MGLSFLVPAFLLGLAAVVVPIVVHLRQRERREPVRFPSLMFLSRITHRTTERRRLTNLLLLLLRGLAVALLVLAFARPFARRDPERLAAETRSRAVIVLLDRSMSMGYAGVWPRALDSVRAALDRLSPGDRAALIAFDARASIVQPLTDDRDLVRTRLAGLAPGGGDTRFAPAFRAAREAARDAGDASIVVLLVSDLQRHAIPGLESVDPVPGAALQVVGVGTAPAGNTRVVSVDASREVENGQTTLRVGARVAIKAGAPRTARAVLAIDGRELGSQTASLPMSGVVTLTFDPVRIPESAAAASVRLEPDQLTADDEFRFALAGPSGVRVALLPPAGIPAEELVFIERALAISRAPALDVEVRRDALTRRDLDGLAVVVAADLGPLTGRTADAVHAFVEAGGGLLAFAGPRVPAAAALPEWLPARSGKVIDRASDRGAAFGYINRDHPVFEPFLESLSTDFGAARYFRYRDLVADSTADLLAGFDDGRPAIVAARIGSGRVVMVASPPDGVWSDLPLQPVFLPLVQRLVGWVGGIGEERRSFEVGDVATLPQNGAALVVKEPNGDIRRIGADTTQRTLALANPGFYEVRRDGAAAPVPLLSFAVNPPSAESDLTLADPAEIGEALRSAGDSTAYADEPLLLSAREQEARQSWWAWLLLAVVGLLGAEAWYAAHRSAGVRYRGGPA